MSLLEGEFTVEEARTRIPELIDRATRGEDIRIVNAEGKRVRLAPDQLEFSVEERKAAIREMREIAKRTLPLGCSVRELRDEGRR